MVPFEAEKWKKRERKGLCMEKTSLLFILIPSIPAYPSSGGGDGQGGADKTRQDRLKNISLPCLPVFVLVTVTGNNVCVCVCVLFSCVA